MQPEKREQWEQALNAPIPGSDPRRATESQIEQEGADFMATLAMHQGMNRG